MRNSIFTIMKKELSRFFGDRRLMVSILMPGFLIYIMYSFMGEAMGDMYSVGEDFVPTAYVVNLPDSVAMLGEGAGVEFISIDENQIPEFKAQVESQTFELLAVFPEGFDTAVMAYETTAGTPAPHVALYYNSASTDSQATYSTMSAILNAFESSMANKFDVNTDGGTYDLATDEDVAGMLFASLMPMLLMMFLYSGCASVAPESIAGEKERGTIATMLITPTRRSDIAIGKIISLAIIALLSGASSALGTILSLPKLMGGVMDEMNTNIYSVSDYLLLSAVILSTVLLLVTIIAILSAYAKTIKEAQTYGTPLMLLNTLTGASAMFGGGASQELLHYCIPLYNSVQCITGIFSFSAMPAGVAVTVAVNGALTILGVVILARMFNSEKIIYSN